MAARVPCRSPKPEKQMTSPALRTECGEERSLQGVARGVLLSNDTDMPAGESVGEPRVRAQHHRRDRDVTMQPCGTRRRQTQRPQAGMPIAFN
jgi:hypothetical protein